MRALFADGPALCGHRGSGRGVVGGHRENTVDSCRAAVAAGLRWVEVDARLNADGELVSRHDPVVEDGRFISTMTTDETDAAGLMRIADLLEELPAEVGIDLDVKTSLEDARRPREQTTAALVADLVARRGGSRPIVVSSFDPSALLIAREREPSLHLGLLTWGRFPLRKAIPAAVHLGAHVVAPHFSTFPIEGSGLPDPESERPAAESVAIAHAAGLEVVAWCPKPPQGEQLLAAGVDCLIVDDVPTAVTVYDIVPRRRRLWRRR